jgi:hypothetical protein
VLTLVYSLASTIPGFAAQTGRTLKNSRRFPGVLGVRSVQSAACGGILSAARTRCLRFV